MAELPPAVRDAVRRAEDRDFAYSCEPAVGALLATLAAAVPSGGRILELGTGCGVGTAWLAYGMSGRGGQRLVTVEKDQALADAVAGYPWTVAVDTRVGDIERLLPELGTFDLVFADAEGGKWSGLDLTIDALRPGGTLVVDDMDTTRYPEERYVARIDGVRKALLADDRLVTAELPTASGIIVAARRHTETHGGS